MTRSAFVSIVGRPNVGKSTLLNTLVGEHVAIVSPKPQTTRTRITGILTRGEDQFVFIDTPGMHTPRTKLGDYMVYQVNEGMADVDVALLVTEPTGEIHPIEITLLERLRQNKTPVLLVPNKIDALSKKEQMLEKMAAFAAQHDFAHVIPVSARQGDGIEILLKELATFAKPGPHYFDADSYTEQPERVIVAELVREKLLINLREEIPHGVAVVVEQMKERQNSPIIDLIVTIYCEKDTHKGIIIGAKGETLKKTASQARADIEQFLQTKVNLQCWVKVRKGWRNREDSLRQLGFR
jgi:GTP-binding protein Era